MSEQPLGAQNDAAANAENSGSDTSGFGEPVGVGDAAADAVASGASDEDLADLPRESDGTPAGADERDADVEASGA